MKKRLIAALVCISMLLCGLSTTVYGDFSYQKAPGISEYLQEFDGEAVSATNAAFDGEYLNISPGGSATYEFTLPFDAMKVDIAYSVPETATLKLNYPTNEYTVNLPVGNHLVTLELEPEQLGDLTLTLSSEKRALIKSLTYIKVDDACGGSYSGDVFGNVVQYTDLQEAVQKSVVLMEGSAAIKVRNLNRYINMDDHSETVTMIDDSMHLPVSTLARAFSLYYEDYPELKYVYMSGDSFALYFTEGESYFEKAGSKNAINYLVKYVNGKAYLPVRAIAEMLGYTVIYNDGLTVIDNKLAAEAIVADRAVVTNLKKDLKAYIPGERGTVYHVSKAENASNLNDGSEAAPFATIQMAANLAKAGDTVIIHEGTYRETVTVKNNGTAGNPIIFKPADGESVTVSAFEEVTHFAPYVNEQNGVAMYMSDINGYKFNNMLEGCWDVDRNMVILNDEMLTEGRHPNKKTSVEKTQMRFNGTAEEEFTFAEVPDFNSDYPELNNHKMLPVQGDMRIRDVVVKGLAGLVYNHTIESDVDLNAEAPDYWKDAIYIGLVGKGWQPSAIQVTSSKKGEATATEVWKGEVGTVTYYQDKYANDYGYLTHHINTVDMPGEWYIDNKEGQFFIIPPEGVDPATMKYEMKTRQVTFDLTGRNYVQIHNINTRGGGITMANAQGCILNGGTHKYISQFDISAMYDMDSLDNIYKRINPYNEEPIFADGPALTNCDLSGETGFALSGLYNAIVNTDIEYSSGAGITVTGSYNYVENNKIDKTGYGSTYQGGIYVVGRHQAKNQPLGGHQIYQNTSTGAGRACFGTTKLVAAAPMDVAFNEFAYGMLMGRDGGTVYSVHSTGGTEYNHTAYHHNSVHDIAGFKDDSLLTCAFYNDGETGLYDIYDNLLYFSTDDPSHTGRTLFNQGGTMEAELDKWSNTQVTFESPDKTSFSPADYPGAYPFEAGARDKADRSYMTNYNKERYNFVANLANGSLGNGAYVDGDGFVILPTENDSVTASGVKIGNNGSKLSIFYSSDNYVQNVEDIAKAKIEFFKNGQSVGTQEVELFAHAPLRKYISRTVMYVPSIFAGCDTVKLTTNNSGIRYANVAVSDFNYDEENAKRDVKFDAEVIPAGSFDRVDVPANDPSGAPEPKVVFSEEAANDLSYWKVNGTRQNGFYYKDVTIDKACEKLFIAGQTNYRFGFSKASIYLGSDANGELIGEVDFSEKRSQHDAWGRSNFEGTLLKTLQPGTYDLYVKFNNTSDAEGEFGMSIDFESIVLY